MKLSLSGLMKAFAFIFGISPFLFVAPLNAAETMVLDTNRILQECKAALKAREHLEKQRDLFQKELSDQESRLREEEQELIALQKKGAPDFSEKRAAFDKKMAGAHEKVADRRKKLEQIFHDSRAQIINVVMELSEAYKKEKKVSLVIPRSAVIVFDKSLDITDEILKRLNKQLPEIKLENAVHSSNTKSS